MRDDRGGWVFGALLVLLSSAVVLVSEIVAARVIAPYVGLTLETFSAVIGCVLAGISLGSWFGGWLADRVPTRTLLTGALALGGVALIASPYIVRAAGPGATARTTTGAIYLAAVGFLLPSIALSAVTPTVLKAVGQGSSRLGSVAGAISAIGTGGALLGNFGAGFVLVGSLRAGQILVLCGATCLLLAAVTVLLYDRVGRAGTARTAAAVVLAVSGLGGSQLGRQLPCDAETKYVCLNIEETAPDTYLIRSNIAYSSVTNAADPKQLGFSYVRDVAELVETSFAPSQDEVAFGYLGGGGYTLPLYFEATYGESSHTVYEIDAELVDRVTTTLGITDRATRFPTRIGDARTTLPRTPSRTFDVLVGDAFSGLTVPWHLTTREFLADVDRVLRPGGMYVMNLIDHDRFKFARAEAQTFRRVFQDVVMVVTDDATHQGGMPASNILLVGGDDLPDVEALNTALRRHDDNTRVIAGSVLTDFIGDAVELTDEFAPVDQLIGGI